MTSQDIANKEEATIISGNLLVDNGYVQKEYVDSMLEKLEKEGYATYIGNGVAIPHGMESGKNMLNLLEFPLFNAQMVLSGMVKRLT